MVFCVIFQQKMRNKSVEDSQEEQLSSRFSSTEQKFKAVC